MKALKRLLVAGSLVALAVFSTALAGSAYAGFAAPGEPLDLMGQPLITAGDAEVYLCEYAAGEGITDCEPATPTSR